MPEPTQTEDVDALPARVADWAADYDLFDPPYVEDPFGFWSVLRRSFVGTLTATRLGLHRDSHVRAGTHLARRLVGDLGSYSIAS
jgi:hypothetical protein